MPPENRTSDTASRLSLYRQMALIRAAEEWIHEHYGEDTIRCPTHLSSGQEAVAVGICAALKEEDIVYSTHRCHAHYLAKGGNLRAMAAELFGKATGCARGRGGSMHLIDTDVGMYGASAIVGGSLPLPVGAALAFAQRGLPHVGVAFCGDSAPEGGVFHESLRFAALRELPVVFVCENNLWATMSRIEARQRTPIAGIAEGSGVSCLPVEGNDVEMVLAAARTAVDRARSGGGPTLIVADTYRWHAHVEHNAGIMKRPAEEEAAWRARCPLLTYRTALIARGVPAAELDRIDRETETEAETAFRDAREDPLPDIQGLLDHVGGTGAAGHVPEPEPGNRPIAYTAAVAEATVQAMEENPDLVVMGVGVNDPNGIFGTTRPPFERFGAKRVFDTPLSEATLTGVATGASMSGLRVLHVHARVDFLPLCLDQLANHMAKWRYMSGGKLAPHPVVRAIIGRSRGQGAQHSQGLHNLLAYFPGLQVVLPADAYDAKGLLLAALRDDAPTIVIEHRLCHPMVGTVPKAPYEVPVGKAKIRRAGDDVTIVALSHMVHEALRAAELLQAHGISCEVVDLRSLRPWDTETVLASVAKTRGLVVADVGWIDFGAGAEIVATAVERVNLKARPARIGLPPCPTPVSEVLEQAYYPGPKEIVLAAARTVGIRQINLEDLDPHAAITGPF